MSIEKIIGLTSVNSFSDIVNLNNFVFNNYCWKYNPNNEWTKVPFEKRLNDIENITKKIMEKEIGGWCGGNAMFLSLLLSYYNNKQTGYNYGIEQEQFTHVTIKVQINEKEYLLDPYFARYYTYEDRNPIQFNNLINYIKEEKFDLIKSKYCDSCFKEVETSKGLIKFNPIELETSVIESWYNRGLKEALINNYGNDNPLSLLLTEVK